MKSLFRKEAVEHQYRNDVGGLQLRQPCLLRILVAGTTAFFLAVVGFLYFAEVENYATINGYLAPVGGFVPIVAPQDGILARDLLGDGAEVKMGQVLSFVVSDDPHSDGQQDDAMRAGAVEFAIFSPVTGSIVSGTVSAGVAVRRGAPLARLLPAHVKLEAYFSAPSNVIGHIQEGSPVALRYRAFSSAGSRYLHMGHVARVSRSAVGTDLLERSATHRELSVPAEPYYHVVVSMDEQVISALGSEHVLLPGMLVDARIFLGRRRLIESFLKIPGGAQ